MNTFRLGIREIILRWPTALSLGAVIALPILFFIILSGYQTGLESRYLAQNTDLLLIQESGSMGEFYGSRLPASLEQELLQLSYDTVVPQINTVTGTTPENAVLLKGVDLDLYRTIESYRITEGRPLLPDEKPRHAMIGAQLARQRNVLVGETIILRGREFQVVGIFENGTYADFEAWISLNDAQSLLGWEDDISVFIIPATGVLKANSEFKDGISVVQKGESGRNLVSEWQPFFNLLNDIILIMSVAVGVSITHGIWRVAWQRKRDIAILISLGFNRFSLFSYLFSQGVVVVFIGLMLAGFSSWVIARFFRLSTAGISIEAVFDIVNLAKGFIVLFSVTIASAIYLVGTIRKKNVIELMKIEE